jgi:SAM-dependent methyltransferase
VGGTKADDRIISCCRSCSSRELRPILSLGTTPLANRLLDADQLDEPEPYYPLDVVFCAACSLVQITYTVPPDELFSEYAYFSSFSDTMLESAREISRRMAERLRLGSGSLAMEIASNDGYLLRNYQELGIPVLGIEPARNIARVAEERGVPTRCAFFGRELAGELRAEGLRADALHANNVLAHVADLNGVVSGIAAVLKPEAVAVVEVPYVRDLIERVEFDTIYHEHLCYFSLSALVQLFARHDLSIWDVERAPIHGGSLRLFVSPTGARAAAARVEELLEDEARIGMDGESFYLGFGRKVEELRRQLLDLLSELRAEGRRVAAYGASAKGSTLLNYFAIGSETVEFVVDRSDYKQGRYTPGTHLLILPPEELLTRRPEYVLLLTWNFADEILAQQEEYRRQGGRFIIPIPRVEVV